MLRESEKSSANKEIVKVIIKTNSPKAKPIRQPFSFVLFARKYDVKKTPIAKEIVANSVA